MLHAHTHAPYSAPAQVRICHVRSYACRAQVQVERWAVSVWYQEAAASQHADASADGADDSDADGDDGGCSSMYSFGNSVEEIESFLLALGRLNGDSERPGDGAAAKEHYVSMLSSW